ncbi:MAG TPA: ABC transporter permease [Intrasporangiaceae bacterium]|nr:ABC transporter permease [Intrasporangiaceae bacterium]
MIARIIEWLTSASSWSGSTGIGTRLWEHLLYSGIVMALTCVIAVPLGLYIGHSGRAGWAVTLANAARAIPTLGLLFAMALWLGPQIRSQLAFVIPSIIVLVLLAIPPVLSGAYAGVASVEPAARDAAKGVGMRPLQVLTRVEIPCALPLLISGIRAATLQVIATATIAAYVGLGGLGRFLIDGLAAGNYVVTAGGALLVAVLALVIDALLALLERAAVSPGLTGRSTGNTGATIDPATDPVDDRAATAAGSSSR